VESKYRQKCPKMINVCWASSQFELCSRKQDANTCKNLGQLPTEEANKILWFIRISF